jgi:hypothetical protein
MRAIDMKRHRFVRGLKFVLFATLFVTVFGFVVMSLWNWLMPALFGWHLINFWQAVGILVLSKILFGGFRGHPGRHLYWRRRMMERWEQMTARRTREISPGDARTLRTIRTGCSGAETLSQGSLLITAMCPLRRLTFVVCSPTI